jgi:subtilisin family serine protease
MKKMLLYLFTILSFSTFSQAEDAWVFLKDKPNANEILQNPSTILSARALDRRFRQEISLDEKDVPIHPEYYNQLKNEGNITVLGKSKWLNAIHIQGTVSQINGLLPNFPFIASIEFANKSLNLRAKKNKKQAVPNHHNKLNTLLTKEFNYGVTSDQIKMLKGEVLHNNGWKASNQIIAVIDAGFPNVNTLKAFERVRENNQILGGYNFADRNSDFYTRNSHGTHVLSTMAGYLEDEYVGSAPDAKYYLFITEIAESETVLEETLWVEAAEKADSLGVNVINSSLGYTTYDNPNHSHSYEDMDGKTTFVSRGAEIAASRGMLVVNSVGNSGGGAWKYMGAPADAPSVIAVGAVNSEGNIASFSSFGPTKDNRIKPEIVAQGLGTAIINYSDGETSTSNGTSFSSPIIAGLVACLNESEARFVKSNVGKRKKRVENLISKLKQSLYKSSNRFSNPDDQYGYGIPNFINALDYYHQYFPTSVDDFNLVNLKINPNPITTHFSILNLEDNVSLYSLQIFSIRGKELVRISKLTSKEIDISKFESGLYILKIQKGNQQKMIKLMKK